MTGTELARRLEVDIRTVRNYIQTLADLGVPISAERGRYRAYFLRPGYKLPPLIETSDESLALTLSLLVAREHGLAQTLSAFEGVLDHGDHIVDIRVPRISSEPFLTHPMATLIEGEDLTVLCEPLLF